MSCCQIEWVLGSFNQFFANIWRPAIQMIPEEFLRTVDAPLIIVQVAFLEGISCIPNLEGEKIQLIGYVILRLGKVFRFLIIPLFIKLHKKL